jgi:hypothetical protein
MDQQWGTVSTGEQRYVIWLKHYSLYKTHQGVGEKLHCRADCQRVGACRVTHARGVFGHMQHMLQVKGTTKACYSPEQYVRYTRLAWLACAAMRHAAVPLGLEAVLCIADC